MEDRLVRIGVFYDGNYFLQVSNYYAYGHERQRRLSISGIHNFIKHQVAEKENTDFRLCQIVDSHYFRGRLNAVEASQKGDTLYYDRVFDDILMSEGVTTHYLPLKSAPDGSKQEKGIDVWLALEAFEQSFYKRFNVLVLIASDGDYVPLVRKLNTIGTRVMVLGWDFEYMSESHQKFTTRTSQDLLEEVSYPIQMSKLIDDRLGKTDPFISNLFVQTETKRPIHTVNTQAKSNKSEILSLGKGFGFIKFPPNNLFFHYSDLIGTEFKDLSIGDKVDFSIDKNQNGEDVAKDVRLAR
ncbi:MAG: NYN domain-containing protein [Bacteroidetes bacterium]|nr:NYN domain-containing protein [Bacteroidota bacterium]